MFMRKWFDVFRQEATGDGEGGGGTGGGEAGATGEGGAGGDSGSLIPDSGGSGDGAGSGDSGGAGDGAAGEGGDGGDGTWYYAEGMAGEGDRPEWFLADKYKSVEEQARAYPELAKKLGGFTGAPESYELSMPEGIEGEVNAEDPLLQSFMEKAKASNMSQETFTDLLHDYITKEAAGVATSKEQEMAQLGKNAGARVQSLADWASANLPEEKFDSFRRLVTTAESVEVLESIIQQSREGRLPSSKDAQNPTGMTAEKLEALRNQTNDKGQRLMDVDPAHRKKVRKAYEEVYGTGPDEEVVHGR